MNTYFSVFSDYRSPIKTAKEKSRDRVRVEKRELDVKYKALEEFLDNPNNFNSVDSFESGLMYEQKNAMKHYREALAARINLWEAE